MMSCAKVGTISNLRPEHIHYVNISSANTFVHSLSLQDGNTLSWGLFLIWRWAASLGWVGWSVSMQQHWNWSCDHFGTELKLFCIFLPLSYIGIISTWIFMHMRQSFRLAKWRLEHIHVYNIYSTRLAEISTIQPTRAFSYKRNEILLKEKRHYLR